MCFVVRICPNKSSFLTDLEISLMNKRLKQSSRVALSVLFSGLVQIICFPAISVILDIPK